MTYSERMAAKLSNLRIGNTYTGKKHEGDVTVYWDIARIGIDSFEMYITRTATATSEHWSGHEVFSLYAAIGAISAAYLADDVLAA